MTKRAERRVQRHVRTAQELALYLLAHPGEIARYSLSPASQWRHVYRHGLVEVRLAVTDDCRRSGDVCDALLVLSERVHDDGCPASAHGPHAVVDRAHGDLQVAEWHLEQALQTQCVLCRADALRRRAIVHAEAGKGNPIDDAKSAIRTYKELQKNGLERDQVMARTAEALARNSLAFALSLADAPPDQTLRQIYLAAKLTAKPAVGAQARSAERTTPCPTLPNEALRRCYHEEFQHGIAAALQYVLNSDTKLSLEQRRTALLQTRQAVDSMLVGYSTKRNVGRRLKARAQWLAASIRASQFRLTPNAAGTIPAQAHNEIDDLYRLAAPKLVATGTPLEIIGFLVDIALDLGEETLFQILAWDINLKALKKVLLANPELPLPLRRTVASVIEPILKSKGRANIGPERLRQLRQDVTRADGAPVSLSGETKGPPAQPAGAVDPRGHTNRKP